MEVENRRIILKPIPQRPRQGWDTAFQRMAERGDDVLILPEEPESKDFEWEW
jgi:hypothetical protein